ncbi:UDP-glucose-4-epimerase [Bernardetia litoralis DSM 6794]|uniref:UDP-glucose 4-epimerase n=1 Tax=Bernardetia litoralis (strain ATCC 23117 / DSM 6794 / NBRC 15988 / NCIMB 1366 / Fx l1 / Sio-4) TaxID=880071 RepID=I4AIL9_BERLS|nr:UDP-glucose 4-epimerase GalE [Bernardetia litoralis]AFM03804.1 UDP-glucose-4-epimerase [Bernardetia litoralis DSM 6794]
MQKKIIITGGCGYIGSHTVVECLENYTKENGYEQDYEIISIDNHLNSSSSVIENIENLTDKKVKNYDTDLCDYDKTKEIFEKEADSNSEIIGIIHFAALKSVPDSVADPVFYYQNNLNSLLNILKLSKEYTVKNFIFSSSCSVYGNTTDLPVSENTAFGNAESPYAYTKQVGERMIIDFAKTSKHQKFVLLRYFNPAGAHISAQIGEDPKNPPTSLVPIITLTAAGKRDKMHVHGSDYATRDGSCIRDYIHVSDIAIAHRLAIDYLVKNEDNDKQVEIFNLGTGNGVTVLEAIKAFEKVSNTTLNYELGGRREGDVVEIYADNQKAKTLLGWIPKFGIEEMMLSAWKWQQKIL